MMQRRVKRNKVSSEILSNSRDVFIHEMLKSALTLETLFDTEEPK